MSVREIGIIKWFGGYNAGKGRDNDYGFVATEGKPDLYVHRSECRCQEDYLIEGTPISFEIGMNHMTNKEQAKDVLLLSDDTDADVIARAARMKDQKFWQPVIRKFFGQVDAKEGAKVAIEKLNSLTEPLQRDFARRLPDELKSVKEIKPFVPED